MKEELCEVCGKKIETMAFRGTGVCGDDHRKVRAGEKDPARALTHAADPTITGILNQPEGVDPGGIV